MASAAKTARLALNQWVGTEYPSRQDFVDDNKKIDDKFIDVDSQLEKITKYQTAGGTATAITLTDVTLEDGYSKTFIVGSNNEGADTTINEKPLYKPGGVLPPTLKAGKAVTVWYDTAGDCFFIKASAEGNTVAGHVLADDTFSNDEDTGLNGTMTNNGAVNITPGTADQTIPEGYHNGLGKVAGDPDLIAANILSGKSIFNIVGSLIPGKKYASGEVTVSVDSSRNWTMLSGGYTMSMFTMIVSGLDFIPAHIRAHKLDNTYEFLMEYSDDIHGLYQKSVKVCRFYANGTDNGASTYHIRGDVAPASVIYGGFTLPAPYGSGIFHWEAWGY